MMDERLEYLITRQLDGRISEAELLELNKAMIRSPAVHRLVNEYQANDALAAETLRDVFKPIASPVMPNLKAPLRSRWRTWTIVRPVFLAAAAVALAVMVRGLSWSWNVVPLQDHNTPILIATPGPADAESEPQPATPRNVLEPRYVHEYMPRDFLAVMDEQARNIYLLEMERPRSNIVPVRMRY